MRKRWIGAPNPDPENGIEDAGHDVAISGRQIGTVKHGEVLTVPDEVWAEIVAEAKEHDVPLPAWPDSLWEDVPDRPAAKLQKGEG